VTKYRERLEAGEFAPPAAGSDLDAMTKQELLEYGKQRGVQVSNDMSKADILAAVKAAGA